MADLQACLDALEAVSTKIEQGQIEVQPAEWVFHGGWRMAEVFVFGNWHAHLEAMQCMQP